MSNEREKTLSRILGVSVMDVATFMKDCPEEEAQTMVDYLSMVVCRDGKYLLESRENPILTLLSKIAATHRIVPCRYRLQPIPYDQDDPVAGGGTSEVFKATFAGETPCIKALRLATDNEEKLRGHIKELILWSHMSHPNILPFFGVFFGGKTRKVLRLVSPWISRGNLSSYLRSTNHPQKYRFHFIVDIIKGLSYLHDLRIVHSDLKGDNVLVSDYDRALITDFGSSHISTASAGSNTMTSVSMTYVYAAPEILMGVTEQSGAKKRPTSACDVWSFGGLCCEVLSRKPPFENTSFPVVITTVCIEKSHSKRPSGDVDDSIDDERWEFISKKCWAWNPQDRPDCKTIEGVIEAWNLGSDTRPKAEKISWPSSVKHELPINIQLDRVDGLLHNIQDKFNLGVPPATNDSSLGPITVTPPEKTVDNLSNTNGSLEPSKSWDKVLTASDPPSPSNGTTTPPKQVVPLDMNTTTPERLRPANLSFGKDTITDKSLSRPASAARPRILQDLQDFSKDDIIIMFMGPTGSGKSTIIDLLTGEKIKRSGEGLKSVTTKIEAVRVRHPKTGASNIVLVDTPGFDDTSMSDVEILAMLSDWLVKTYRKDLKVSGLLYLHNITDARMTGTAYKNLRAFASICGDSAASRIVLVSTKWQHLATGEDKGMAERRQTELEERFWRPFLHHGSTIERLTNNNGVEAWRIVDDLIQRNKYREGGTVLLLQEELVDLGCKLGQTTAGSSLRDEIREHLSQQNDVIRLLRTKANKVDDPDAREELEKECKKRAARIQAKFNEVAELEVSLGTRLLMSLSPKRTQSKAIKIGSKYK